MANGQRARSGGMVSSLTNFNPGTVYIDPDYDIAPLSLVREANRLLPVFSLSPKSGIGPTFSARLDDGSSSNKGMPDLDIDIGGVSNTAVGHFRNCRNGYCGHHTDKSLGPTSRVFEVEIKIPDRLIFRTHPTSAVLSDAGYFAKRVTLSLALRSSGDAGRGFGRVGAAAALVAG